MTFKQYIVARKDLKMPPGKLAAQVSHASMGAITQYFLTNVKKTSKGDVLEDSLVLNLHTLPNIKAWLANDFTKVVLAVTSEKELIDLYVDLYSLKLDPVLIRDNGLTCFHGQVTPTCFGLPPYKDMSKWLGHLKLY